MKTFILIVAILALHSSEIAVADDFEYALNIRHSNSEYGTRIPKELCENGTRNPCKINYALIRQIVTNIADTKQNLSLSAWSALKRSAREGQETWGFDLCAQKWKERKDCRTISGYVVIKNYNAIFYAFHNEDSYRIN